MPSALLPSLVAAIEPIAAYVARTPPPNRHADHCADLIDAASEYVDAVAEEEKARAAQPNWQAIADQMIRVLELPPSPNLLILRIERHLRQPALKERAAWPLAQRMIAAECCSHHLGLPDSLR
jgi:hypothetical protein